MVPMDLRNSAFQPKDISIGSDVFAGFQPVRITLAVTRTRNTQLIPTHCVTHCTHSALSARHLLPILTARMIDQFLMLLLAMFYLPDDGRKTIWR